MCRVKDANIFTPSKQSERFFHCCVLRACVEVGERGQGHSSGRALGKLQDVHLAAGHRAHYHSRTWSHQRAEERANILLKCHCQQACAHTHRHTHKRQPANLLLGTHPQSVNLSVAPPLPSETCWRNRDMKEPPGLDLHCYGV